MQYSETCETKLMCVKTFKRRDDDIPAGKVLNFVWTEAKFSIE